jgi:catechol 2,3-dioxygenase-like lactoylglutathione lyase family enzyme
VLADRPQRRVRERRRLEVVEADPRRRRVPAQARARLRRATSRRPRSRGDRSDWPSEQYGALVGAGVRFELFVYVDGLDELVEELRADGVSVLREPADMPWGERVAYVADPDGNPVALTQSR